MSIPRIEKSSYGEVLLPEVSEKGSMSHSPVAIKWRTGSDVVTFYKGGERIELPVKQLSMLYELLPNIVADASSSTPRVG